MAHIGLVAALLEDVSDDRIPHEGLEPLFTSVEGYIRMREKAEKRAEALPDLW